MGYIKVGKNVYGNFELKLWALPCATPTDKFLYVYMRHQYNYFKKQGRDYFESIDSLMESLALSKNTVLRSISNLEKLGWLSKKTHRNSLGYKQNTYQIHDWQTEESQNEHTEVK